MKININKFEEETIMKTQEELNAIKEEMKAMDKKLAELTEDELEQVTGGAVPEGIPIQTIVNVGEKDVKFSISPSHSEPEVPYHSHTHSGSGGGGSK